MFDQASCKFRSGCTYTLDSDTEPTQIIGSAKVMGNSPYAIESTECSKMGRIEAIRVFA